MCPDRVSQIPIERAKSKTSKTLKSYLEAVQNTLRNKNKSCTKQIFIKGMQ